MIPTCLGLIPCTPTPIPAPVGLTILEQQHIGNLASMFLILGFVGITAVLVIAFTMAVVIITRRD